MFNPAIVNSILAGFFMRLKKMSYAEEAGEIKLVN